MYFRHQPEHPIVSTHNLQSQLDFRRFVVQQLRDPVLQACMNWADYSNDYPVDDWINSMSENFEELDEQFIRLASEVLKRKIVVYHVVGDQILTYNETFVDNPIYLLYFEEYRFNSQGHYQSIVPFTDLHLYQVMILTYYIDKYFYF